MKALGTKWTCYSVLRKTGHQTQTHCVAGYRERKMKELPERKRQTQSAMEVASRK